MFRPAIQPRVSLVPTVLLTAVAAVMFTAPTTVFAADPSVRVTLLRSDDSGLEFRVDLLELNIQPAAGTDRYRVAIPGEPSTGLPGTPDLPRVSRMVAIPADAAVQLNWEVAETEFIPAHQPLTVTAPEDIDGFEAATPPTPTAGLYPRAPVEMGEPAVMRGHRLVTVSVNPVQVEPSSGDLTVNRQVVVRLEYTRDPAAPPARMRPSRQVTRLVQAMVLNPDDVRRDDAAAENGSIVYVMPDFDGVGEALRPLVEWRRKQGHNCQLLVVDEDASNVDVKNAIQEAYDEWEHPPDIITLVGEADLRDADFMIPTWDVGRAYMWETDHPYVMLEGQDILPEAAIGRISCRSLGELNRLVEKIINYETEPSLEDDGWFVRAALMSNDDRTGYSSIYLQRWARKLLREVGFAEVDTFYFIHENAISGHNFIRENINNGISLFNYRGWGQFNGDWTVGDSRQLRNSGMLPFLLLPTCNSNDFADHVQFSHSYAEDFLWAQQGGAIGAVGSSGYTHTNYNNVFDGGVLNGFYRDRNWTLGWALMQGKVELYRHFGMFDDAQDPQVPNLRVWEAVAYQMNLIGDAATELWTAIPTAITVTHPDTLLLGGNRFRAEVLTEADETPVDGSVVTLLADGEPLRSGSTDTEGVVEFTFEPDELEPGTLELAVSKHDHLPYFSDVAVVEPEAFLGVSSFLLDDDNAGRSNGNGDGNANPGERLELRVTLANFGDEALQDRVTVRLEPVMGDVQVVDGEVEVDPPEMGEEATVTFTCDVGGQCWNGSRVVFDLLVGDEEDARPSRLEFPVAAPDLRYVNHSFQPEEFLPGDTVWVDVTLRNAGGLDSPVMSAELVSQREVINVFNPWAEFDPVEVEGEDSLATARFRLYAHTLTIPGTPVTMLLNLESESGFCDTVAFGFTVGVPRSDTPFGPDAYGYGCFDDSDEGWEDVRPVYEWVEIDPDSGGEGVDTEINDLGNEQDWSVLVELPEEFSFQYYGQDFREITICSNGWFAFGDESKLADFQNRRIPPALGPRAQVCVFWDDMVNYTDEEGNRIGGVYYWFDEENHRFIIEWSRMRRYVGMEEGQILPGAGETFQAILYDPQHYQTYTGDGEITFQYHTVSNEGTVDPHEFDTPFATVGIVNLNGTDGMEYTFWNEYTPGAAPLESERAIKFTTILVPVVGHVRGRVSDAATGGPIAGAEIRGNRGAFGLTDVSGNYFMENVLVGEEYTFTAWAPGYNDSTAAGEDGLGFTVAEGETLTVDFSLLHPDFTLSRDSLAFRMQPDHEAVADIRLANTGNGPLEFHSYFDYPAGGGGERWRRLLDFNATEITGDSKLNGVDFYAGMLWVTGSNNIDNPNYFYRFNTRGERVNTVEQPGGSTFGMRGTASDGELLWGGEGDWIIGVDAEGEAVDSIAGPLALQRALACEPDGEHFWVANGRQENLVRVDRDGNVSDEYPLELDIYGLGWFPADQEGYPLYILSRDKTNPSLQVPEALVSKLNPATGDLRSVTVLEGELTDRAGGMEISSNFDPRKWVMLALLTNPDGDRVSVYDMGPNTNWISYEPRTGTLPAGAETDIHVVVNSTGLVQGEYSLLLRFIHNARRLSTGIPVVLIVDSTAAAGSEPGLPTAFGLEVPHPNPFNSRTTLTFALPTETRARLALYDLTGRLVAELVDDKLSEGRHTVSLDGSRLATGVYLLKLTAGHREAARKVVLVK